MKNKKYLNTIIVVTTALFIFGIVYYLFNSNISDTSESEKYPLLSRRLFAENQNDLVVNLAPLRSEIRNYLKDVKIENSTYIEYLPSGVSIRIGDQEQLIGASLMKVPTVMDLYKASEKGDINLDQEVEIDKQALSNTFGDLYQKGEGSTIKIKEAARLALTESDNTAARVVLEQTQKYTNPEDRAYNFLDIEKAENPEGNLIYISARSYSSFFKCLYLSCYLNRDNSQYLLEEMTKSSFSDLLVKGVDNNSVKISHKIGTFDKMVTSDCGIVYIPKRPYMICTMFKSTDEATKKYIQDISRMTYQYITNVSTPDNGANK